jgi:predicted ATPase
LRATLDWSFGLLSEAERTLFGRLAVFGGGFTIEAAEAVCSGEAIPQGDVLDLLAALIDKSLVVADTSDGGGARYRLPETLRRYVWDRLS